MPFPDIPVSPSSREIFDKSSIPPIKAFLPIEQYPKISSSQENLQKFLFTSSSLQKLFSLHTEEAPGINKEKYLQKLSYLNDADIKTTDISYSVLYHLFQENPMIFSLSEILELLRYMQTHTTLLTQERVHNISQLQEELMDVYHLQNRLEKTTTPADQQDKTSSCPRIKKESQELRKKILEKKTGQHTLLFTGYRVNIQNIYSYIKTFLPLNGQYVQQENLILTLSAEITSHLLKIYKEQVQTTLKTTEIRNTIQSTLHWFLDIIWSKEEIQTFDDSLQDLFIRKLLENLQNIFSDAELQMIYQNLQQKDKENCLHSIIHNSLQHIFAHLQTTLEKILESTFQMIPSSFSYLLSQLHKGIKTETICIDFQKQEDGKYCLYIYGGRSSHLQHMDESENIRMPLIFTNIEKDLITEDFIQALLFFRSPHSTVSYSLTDIYTAIRKYLQTADEPFSSDRQCQLQQGSDLHNIFSYLWQDRLKISSLENFSQEEITTFDEQQKDSLQEMILFRLHKKALIDGWHQYKKNPHDIRFLSLLQAAAIKLTNEAENLLKKTILSEEEKERSIATAWHILQLTTSQSISSSHSIQEALPPVLIPAQIKALIQNTLHFLGIKQNTVELIKKALEDILGPQVHTSINHIINEIVEEIQTETNKEKTPQIHKRDILPPRQKSKIETDIFWYSSLISKITSYMHTYVINFSSLAMLHKILPSSVFDNIFPSYFSPRMLISSISLIGAITLEQLSEDKKNKIVNAIATICSFMINTLLAKCCYYLLQTALSFLFPGSLVISILANPLVQQLVTIGGGYFISLIIPEALKDWYRQKYQEIYEYIIFQVLTKAGKYLLSPKIKENMQSYFSQMEKFLTRSASMSFDVPTDAVNIGKATIIKPQTMAPASSSFCMNTSSTTKIHSFHNFSSSLSLEQLQYYTIKFIDFLSAEEIQKEKGATEDFSHLHRIKENIEKLFKKLSYLQKIFIKVSYSPITYNELQEEIDKLIEKFSQIDEVFHFQQLLMEIKQKIETSSLSSTEKELLFHTNSVEEIEHLFSSYTFSSQGLFISLIRKKLFQLQKAMALFVQGKMMHQLPLNQLSLYLCNQEEFFEKKHSDYFTIKTIHSIISQLTLDLPFLEKNLLQLNIHTSKDKLESLIDVTIDIAENKIKQARFSRLATTKKELLSEAREQLIQLTLHLPFLDTQDPLNTVNIWNQFEDKEKILNKIFKLSWCLSQATFAVEAKNIKTLFEQHQIAIASFSLYAINAHLSCNDFQSSLRDFLIDHNNCTKYSFIVPPINISHIQEFLQHSYSVIEDPILSKRLEEICRYFYIDPHKKRAPQLLSALDTQLFSFITGTTINFDFFHHPYSLDQKYLKSLLQDPIIQEKMHLHGIMTTDNYEKRLAFLLSNPPAHKVLQELSRSHQRTALKIFHKNTHKNDKYLGLLPQSYYFLMLQNIFCELKGSATFPNRPSLQDFQTYETHGFAIFSEDTIREASYSPLYNISPEDHVLVRTAKHVGNFPTRIENVTEDVSYQVRKKFHQVTNETFLQKHLQFPQFIQKIILRPNYQENAALLTSAFQHHTPASQVTTGKWLETQRLFQNVSVSFFIDILHMLTTTDNLSSILEKKDSQRQNDILKASITSHQEFNHKLGFSYASIFPNISPRERQELKMIPLVKDDELIRILSYLQQHPQRLKNPSLQHLFILCCLRFGAFIRQLEDTSEAIVVFQEFFRNMLQIYIIDGDVHISILLIEMAMILQQYLYSMNRSSLENEFIDIRKYLLEDILELAKKKKVDTSIIKLLYNMAIASYENIDPRRLDQKTRQQIAYDLLLWQYIPNTLAPSQEPSDNYHYYFHKALSVWKKWLFPILELIDNEIIRKKLVKALMIAYGISYSSEEEVTDFWFREKGILHIKKNGETLIRLDLFAIENRKRFLLIEPPPIKEELLLEENGKKYFFIDTQTLPNSQTPWIVLHLSCLQKLQISSSSQHQYWLEKTDRDNPFLLIREKDKTIHTLELIRKETDRYFIRILQKFHDEPEVYYYETVFDTSLTSGLAPLSWFCPLQEIKAFTTKEKTGKIARLEIPKYQLSLKVAYDQQTQQEKVYLQSQPGHFYLKENQRLQIPHPFAGYLVFENNKGQQKIFVPINHFFTALTDVLYTKIFASYSSDFLQNVLQPLFDDLLQNLMKSSQHLFQYDMKEKKLTSSNPEALMYLLVYSLLTQNKKETMRLFTELKNIASHQALSNEIIYILPVLLSLGVVIDDADITIVLLKIQSLFEVNQGTQKHDHQEPDNHYLTTFISFGCLQLLYQNYLQKIANGHPAELDQFEELFVLKKIQKIAKQLTSSVLKSLPSEAINNIIESLGLSFFAESYLLSPVIFQRWRQLSQLLAVDETEQQENILQSFFLHWQNFSKGPEGTAVSASETPTTEILLPKPISKLFSCCNKMLSHVQILPQRSSEFSLYTIINKLFEFYVSQSSFRFHGVNIFATLRFDDFIANISLNIENLEEIPIRFEELTEKNLEKYFLAYYHLLKDEPFSTWEKETHTQKRLYLQKSLQLKTGNHSPRQQILLEYLQLIEEKKDQENFLPSSFIFHKRLYLAKLQNINKILFPFIYSSSSQYFMNFFSPFLFKTSSLENSQHYLKALFTTWNSALTSSNLTSFCKDHALSYITSKNGLLADASTKAIAHLTKEAIGSLMGVPGLSTSLTLAQTILPYARHAVIIPQIFYAIKQEKAKFAKQRQELIHALQEQEKNTSLTDTTLVPYATNENPITSLSYLLQEQDLQAEALIESIFTTHFTQTLQPSYTPITSPHHAPSVVSSHFTQLNQSLKSYCHSLPPTKKQLNIFTKDDIRPLQEKLQEIEQIIKKQLQQSKEHILTFVNNKKQPFERSSLSLAMLLEEPKKENLNFSHLLTYFLHDDDEIIRKKTYLTHEEIQKIKPLLQQYLILATRKQQIQRIISLLEKIYTAKKEETESLINDLTFEVTRSRAYTFDTIPKKLVIALLFFEYRNKILLKDKQAKQIIRMLTEKKENPHLVLQLIMGDGKTFMGMPMASFWGSSGNHFVINFFASSLFPTNSRQISGQLQKTFHQASTSLHIKREHRLTEDDLWSILKLLQRAILHNEHILMEKTDLQSLESKFIDDCHKIANSSKQTATMMNQLYYYMKILQIIRTKSIGNLDEIHELFNPSEELNFSLGSKTYLSEPAIKTAERCMYYVMQIKEIQALLQIQNNQQAKISKEDYDKRILPKLCLAIVKDFYFSIAKEDQKEAAKYLEGKTDKIPSFIWAHPMKQQIFLARGYLRQILPSSLNCISSVTFGPSADYQKNGQYARPYKGNEDPDETAIIKTPYEAAIKTFISLIQRRLTKHQMDQLLKKLQQQAKAELKTSNNETLRQNLPTYRFFAKCSKGYNIYDLPSEEMETIYQNLQKSDDFTLAFAEKIACKEIFYFSLNIQNNAQNFGSMFSRYFSFTGSPFNAGVYPPHTKVLEVPETTGETVELLQDKCQSPESIDIVDTDEPFEILDILLEKHFKDPLKIVSALIDAGALFRGKSDTIIAKRILDFIRKHRKDIDGVVFYDNQKREVFWAKGAIQPTLLSESSVPIDKRITYLGNANTFGVDIKQPKKATALVTIGETTTAEKGLYQPVWRMRGLKTLQQSICFVITAAMKKIIVGDDTALTVEDIIKHATQKEAEGLGRDHFLADKQKMENISRRAVLDKILFSSNPEEALKIFTQNRHLFIQEFTIDPYMLYGRIEKELTPEEIFIKIRERQQKILKETKLFTSEELTIFQEQLQEIGSNTYPETVTASISSDGTIVIQEDHLGKTQEVEIEAEIDEQADTKREDQIELHQQNELQMHQQQKNKEPRKFYYPKYKIWKKQLDIRKTDWFILHNLQSSITSITKTLPLSIKSFFPSSEEKIQQAGPSFYNVKLIIEKSEERTIQKLVFPLSSIIWSTSNFCPIVTSLFSAEERMPLGTSMQKPINEVLVIEEEINGQKDIKILILDTFDAAYWRDKLRQDRLQKGSNPIRYALWDIHLQAIVSEGKNPIFKKELIENPDFMLAHVQLKFLNANTMYDKEEKETLKKWLRNANLQIVKSAFFDIHKNIGKQPYPASTINILFEKEELARLEEEVVEAIPKERKAEVPLSHPAVSQKRPPPLDQWEKEETKMKKMHLQQQASLLSQQYLQIMQQYSISYAVAFNIKKDRPSSLDNKRLFPLSPQESPEIVITEDTEPKRHIPSTSSLPTQKIFPTIPTAYFSAQFRTMNNALISQHPYKSSSTLQQQATAIATNFHPLFIRRKNISLTRSKPLLPKRIDVLRDNSVSFSAVDVS